MRLPTPGELWSEMRYRLRMIFRRAAVEREIDEELQFHLEHEAEKRGRAGVPGQLAMRDARVVFGGVSRIKDDTRDAHGVVLVEQATRDLRYALRQLRAHPLFTATVVATLALGVGVNAATFAVLDRMLFRAPSYLIDPSSVSRVYVESSSPEGKRVFDQSFAYREYRDVAQWNRSLSNVATFAYRTMAVGEGDDTRGRVVGITSADYFAFFDARPVLGRFFDASEDRPPNGAAVGVLGYGFWQTEFGGRRDVIGTPVRVGTVVVRVIGVAPPGFEGVSDQRAPAVFLPVTTFAASREKDFDKSYGWSWLELLVRRKPGVGAEAAGADLTNVLLRSWNAQRETEPGLASAVGRHLIAIAAPTQLARGPLAGADSRVARWIGGVALIVLLIACANVANLLLARATLRRREMAVRRALGGSRRRLIQQTLTETSVLAALGSCAGLATAAVSAGALRRLLASTSDAWPVVSDGRTLLFATGLTVLAAVCCGIVPALASGSEDLAGSLKAGMRDTAYRQSKLRETLLVVQTALSVILLIGAGLFIRSLQHVRELPLGYDVEHIVYVESSMRGVSLTPVEQEVLAQRLRDAISVVHGVASASQVVSVPFYSGESRSLRVEGVDSVRKLGRFQLQSGSPEYFKTMGTRILRGRAFDGQDRETTPRVVVISESMGKALWKDADPIGKCIRIGADTAPCTTVIGIAEDTRARNITGNGEFMYYVPISQYVSSFGNLPMLAMFVRVNGMSDDFTEALRSRLQRVMPDPAYVTARPFHEIIDPTMRSWTSGARMFAALGALALLLAAIGLYAVVAFTVSQRTQELGIRIALGALPRDVLGLVVGDGLRLTLVGVVVGTLIAFAVTRPLAALLFGVSPRDPMIYGMVALLLLSVGVFASAVPASRAARVDPNTALRTE